MSKHILPLLFASFASVISLSQPVFAASPGAQPVFVDASAALAAGLDFAIQGEYEGPGCGAQVIALGDGKFRIVGWSKGLPGTHAEAEIQLTVEAHLDADRAVFDSEGWKGQIQSGRLDAKDSDDNEYRLVKTERKSPTLGMPAPQGAIVLFDGKDTAEWKRGSMDERGLLKAGAVTKREFGTFALHLEFATPFIPTARGQGRGNSGVYLQGRHEVQVLDSFGLTGENNECGGIYTVARPRVNMAFPPLTWQTYDIEFEPAQFDAEKKKTKNAVATVRHNGVLIHDRVEVPKATGSAMLKEGPEPGPIMLQDHSNPVVYRNIWIKESAK